MDVTQAGRSVTGGWFPAGLADAGAWGLLALCLVCAVATDLRERRIGNRLLACGLGAALAVALWRGAEPGGLGLAAALGGWAGGLLLGGLPLLPLHLLGGMAAGDVKLMAMAGAFLGPALAWQAALVALAAGGVFALGWVAWHAARRLAAPRGYPYAPAIALGCAFVLVRQGAGG
jgi:Flp pilus assembly protein protease CpaA